MSPQPSHMRWGLTFIVSWVYTRVNINKRACYEKTTLSSLGYGFFTLYS